jgi:DNA-binding Lrp family transcriptional regulator
MRVITLAAHSTPEFKEDRSKDWIMYGTERPWKNRYPDYLLDLFNSSAKHNAIIRGKVDYIVGNGFRVDDKGLGTESLAKVSKFINQPNRYETLDELLMKCSLDLEIYNGFALEIIANKTNQKIAGVYHVDFTKYRKCKETDGYFYSDEWHKTQPKVEYIPEFDPYKIGGKSLLYVKTYHPMSDVYPLPEYLGCVPYVEMDKEIANFHLNSIKNGFMGGTMINFYNGTPTEEEQEAIERKLYDKFSGSDNANKLVLNFNDSREQGAEIIALNGNDFDKRFDILNETVRKEIFSGHRIVDPNLFGIKEDGIFATRNQIRDSYELFQNTYVNQRQRLLEQVFNGLASVQGFEGRLYIEDTEPLGVEFSEATKVSVMTRDEIREAVGLEPLSEVAMSKEVQLSKEDEVSEIQLCDAFFECGLSLDEWEVVESKPVRFQSDKELELSEDRIRKFGFADENFDMAVLEILKENPNQTWAAIAAQLETTVEKVAESLRSLTSKNFLTITEQVVEETSQRVAEVTLEGSKALETAEPLDVTFRIAYRYAKSPEASGADVLPTTREFCRRMVSQSANRVWTNADIQRIGMQENRNVWMRRGGFWTRQGGAVTTPYCRHVWEQVVIKERNG